MARTKSVKISSLTRELSSLLFNTMTDRSKHYRNAIEDYFLKNKVLGRRVWVRNSLGVSYYYRSSRLTEDFKGALLLGVQGYHYLNHIAIITDPKVKDNSRENHYTIDYFNIWVEGKENEGVEGGWYEGVDVDEVEPKIIPVIEETIKIINDIIKLVDDRNRRTETEIKEKAAGKLKSLIDDYL